MSEVEIVGRQCFPSEEMKATPNYRQSPWVDGEVDQTPSRPGFYSVEPLVRLSDMSALINAERLRAETAVAEVAALREELENYKLAVERLGGTLEKVAVIARTNKGVAEDLQQRLAAYEQHNSELVEEIERRKTYALNWETTAHNMCRSRAETLKKVAEGLKVSVFNTPVPMEALEQLMPCECFQLDHEMLVLHSPAKPTESGASEKCRTCGGIGRECAAGCSAHPSNWTTCETCNGSGKA